MTAVPSDLPPPGKERADVAPRQPAAGLLAARRRRVSRIRRGAIVGSLAAFAAAWVVIFSQLVTGHDPALANDQQALAPVPAATASASDTSPQESSGSGYGSSASGGSSPSSTLDPVTTQQS